MDTLPDATGVLPDIEAPREDYNNPAPDQSTKARCRYCGVEGEVPKTKVDEDGYATEPFFCRADCTACVRTPALASSRLGAEASSVTTAP